MKITKRQLKRIIAEECGAAIADEHAPMDMALAPKLPAMAESIAPEAELVTEMEDALSGLQLVAESLDAAALLCQDCVQEVAAQGPVLQAVATQVAAIQEMVGAQLDVVSESVEGTGHALPTDALAELPQEIAAAVRLEARRRLK